ncbi:MAG TPA: divalent-cation tolerance protein CutA [Candidatus Acidoferrales bacterium]|nr:divalent-cation tolerance protein CutA [Candidatus Acidoferrales bacterium]
MTDKIVVLVTCGSIREAKRVAQAVVESRLAACANIVTTPVKSIYWWKGKVETASEVLVVIKSARKRFPALEREIRKLHSYDVTEIIALPVIGGSAAYLDWLEESILSPQPAEMQKQIPHRRSQRQRSGSG